MDVLQVPFGRAPDGRIVRIADADKTVSYCCSGCGDKLVLRAGQIRTKHFAHRPDTQCSLESIWHEAAKRLLCLAVQANSRGERSIFLEDRCVACGENTREGFAAEHFQWAIEEHQVDKFRCDVVAFRNDKEELALEVHYKNRMSEEKRQQLQLPWIELDAVAVLENEWMWRPINSRLEKKACRNCDAIARRASERAQANVAIAQSQALETIETATRFGIERSLYFVSDEKKDENYFAKTKACGECSERVPVFSWTGKPYNKLAPPAPRPHTIKFRPSKFHGWAHWANKCANCEVFFNDRDLYDGYDGVFGDAL